MNLFSEYTKSLKMAEAEEILDLIFYRPIAFVIVKVIYRLPITPNQVTYGSLVAGLIAAYQFSLGTTEGFTWGAVWYAIANVLDCGDGMLARLQKSGTPFGRLVDGVVDWASSVAIFFGLGIGLHTATGNPWVWIPVAAAGVLSGYHAMVFDRRQQEYISTVRGERGFIEREQERIEAEMEKLQAGSTNPLRKMFFTVYKQYMDAQSKMQEPASVIAYSPEEYRRENKTIMRWWSWLGPTTNRTLLMLAAIAGVPLWFCWFVIIPTNLYLAAMSVWQKRVTLRLNSVAGKSAATSATVAA